MYLQGWRGRQQKSGGLTSVDHQKQFSGGALKKFAKFTGNTCGGDSNIVYLSILRNF